MAVVSHPALSPEWSFPSPINPFDAPSFTSHIELADHTAAVGAVHQLQVSNKRPAYEIEWDDEDAVERGESRVKKAKTAASHTVDPQQLHGDHSTHSLPVPPGLPPPQIEQVLSILVDALTSTNTTPTPTSTAPTPPSVSPADSTFTVSISSNAPAKHAAPIPRPVPTSPLSDCPNRVPFVRKVIGGSCSGRTEASLCRWVLCKNHFLGVRCLNPTTQSPQWIRTLHEMGWQELHPYYQAQAAEKDTSTFDDPLSPFSRWIEDDFDYDGTEDGDGEWSDEDEDGEMHDDIREQDGNGQRGVWDSGVVLQLPGKASA